MIETTKGCVSFSLFGDGAKYAVGALENVHLVKKHYPGWECRIYVENGHYATESLQQAGAKVISMNPLPGSGGMFWRFLAVDDKAFTHVIVRDADSRITDREAVCVEEWIASGKPLHIIRDHPAHLKRTIIGGAFGLKSRCVNMSYEIATWPHKYTYGNDEDFLHERVWIGLDDHRVFVRHCFTPAKDDHPFPAHEESAYHVCQQVPLEVNLKAKWQAVVVSPPHYSNRRERFFQRINQSGSFLANKVEWFPGCTAKDCSPPENYPHQQSHPHYFYATKSHIDAIQQGIDRDLDLLFVFEDDAYLHPEFDEQLSRTLMCIPHGWKAIQLGGQAWTDHKRSWFQIGDRIAYPRALALVQGCLGMHGVLWSKEGMNEAIRYYKERPNAIIDWDFAKWQESDDGFYSTSRWIACIDGSTPQDGKDT